MTLLEEHDILTGYPKDCSCKTHTGPHAIAESRQQLRHNFSVIIELMDKEQIPESLYRCFSNMLEFFEAERHRHGILIKNLKFYANDFFQRESPSFLCQWILTKTIDHALGGVSVPRCLFCASHNAWLSLASPFTFMSLSSSEIPPRCCTSGAAEDILFIAANV